MTDNAADRNDKGRKGRSRSRQGAARIEPLAALPLFHKLAGRRVVVTGGGPASAWKAELLCAAGADVVVHAEAMSDEMQALASREHESGFGTIRLVERPWSIGDLEHAALLVGDGETQGEAWALRCAGQAAGVPVNVIDKPAYCDFQFATIVNRSPVVIGISTDGAAPILGQAIRQRVEAVLGPALGAWAQLAQRLRPAVNDRLAMGQERRLFWQAFARRAFGPPPTQASEAEIEAQMRAIGIASAPSAIMLVGAGPLPNPDDPTAGLTLAAVAALQSAEIILHAGVVDAVLELGRREAARERLLDDIPTAAAIATAAEAHASQGRSVAILLPGDPASQWPDLLEALRALAQDKFDLSIAPALKEPSIRSEADYLDAIRN